ncbi:hypothetical protein DBZ36_05400 [Alginatibacterium sediminis]|uniref:Secreted protein n=1 Tax=Alginatibacterium sediminis TaxID=2164068 RepID=A0A420EGQ7_9ALTE|nr:hypothetical protein DBZ36_05400 [Alginatibacterium sediminis]
MLSLIIFALVWCVSTKLAQLICAFAVCADDCRVMSMSKAVLRKLAVEVNRVICSSVFVSCYSQRRAKGGLEQGRQAVNAAPIKKVK